jgi:phosphoglycolate phosphatase
LIGPPLEASFAKLMGTADSKIIDACMRHYRRRYEEVGLFESDVYPGIAEALQALSQDYQIYLATAKPQVYGEKALDHFKLLEHFTAVHGSDFDGARTEKEELIAHIIKRERVHVETALMVGDRKYDVLGAKANGVTSVGVAWGFGSMDELHNAGAEIICTHPDELLRVPAPELVLVA